MQIPGDVITEAADGLLKDLMREMDLSSSRVYALLGDDNPYTKALRLILCIGRINPDRLRLIQADFNARCEEILADPEEVTVSDADLHRDLSHAVQMELELAPLPIRKKALRRVIASTNRRLAKLK